MSNTTSSDTVGTAGFDVIVHMFQPSCEAQILHEGAEPVINKLLNEAKWVVQTIHHWSGPVVNLGKNLYLFLSLSVMIYSNPPLTHGSILINY